MIPRAQHEAPWFARALQRQQEHSMKHLDLGELCKATKSTGHEAPWFGRSQHDKQKQNKLHLLHR